MEISLWHKRFTTSPRGAILLTLGNPVDNQISRGKVENFFASVTCVCSSEHVFEYETPQSQIRYRSSRPASQISLPRDYLRCRSRLREYRRMVARHSGRSTAAQGSTLLPSLRGECRHGICGLCVGAKPASRHVRRSGAPSASRRNVYPRGRWGISCQDGAASLNC